MPASSIFDLPNELLLHIHHFVADANGDQSTFYIETSPRELQPGADALSRTCRALRNIISSDLRITTFSYSSPASGNRSGKSYDDATYDLIGWQRGLACPLDEECAQSIKLRRLRLEMYASELLWLFAPASASALLDTPLPGNRHGWSKVASSLQALQLEDLEIVILEQSCPGPCRHGEVGGGLRTNTINVRLPGGRA